MKAADILMCLWIESNKEEMVEPSGNRSLTLVKSSEEDPVRFLCKRCYMADVGTS